MFSCGEFPYSEHVRPDILFLMYFFQLQIFLYASAFVWVDGPILLTFRPCAWRTSCLSRRCCRWELRQAGRAPGFSRYSLDPTVSLTTPMNIMFSSRVRSCACPAGRRRRRHSRVGCRLGSVPVARGHHHTAPVGRGPHERCRLDALSTLHGPRRTHPGRRVGGVCRLGCRAGGGGQGAPQGRKGR